MNMYIVAFGWLLIASVIVFYVRTKSKERLIMIEKGIDINSEVRKKDNRLMSLRNGIFLFSSAIGLLLGEIFRPLIPDEPIVAYLASVLLFCGIGLIGFFFIAKRYYI